MSCSARSGPFFEGGKGGVGGREGREVIGPQKDRERERKAGRKCKRGNGGRPRCTMRCSSGSLVPVPQGLHPCPGSCRKLFNGQPCYACYGVEERKPEEVSYAIDLGNAMCVRVIVCCIWGRDGGEGRCRRTGLLRPGDGHGAGACLGIPPITPPETSGGPARCLTPGAGRPCSQEPSRRGCGSHLYDLERPHAPPAVLGPERHAALRRRRAPAGEPTAAEERRGFAAMPTCAPPFSTRNALGPLDEPRARRACLKATPDPAGRCWDRGWASTEVPGPRMWTLRWRRPSAGTCWVSVPAPAGNGKGLGRLQTRAWTAGNERSPALPRRRSCTH